MKALRLALVRQRYTPFGGAERFVARAVAALQTQGASVTLVTRQWEDTSSPALICNPLYLGRVWRDWGFARCVCRSVNQQPFDLVQSHERIACCDVYRAGDGVHREWLIQRSRVMRPLGRLGLWLNPYHRYTLAAERRLFSSTQLKAIICNSHMVKAEIQHHFGIPEEKLHVIYSGVDLDAYHPGLRDQHRNAVCGQLDIPTDAPVALFVGSGFERKGLGAALHAVPEAAYLLVVGHDKHTARYHQLADRLGIASRVRFLGPQKDVRPFYGAADVLVLPTLYDPFPNVALEALACGLPVITSTKSGAAEMITPGKNGAVCDALDIPALKQALQQQLAAPQRAAARASVENYRLERMAERLGALYAQLLRTPGAQTV